MYIPSFGRPHRKWTLRQAMGMRVVKAFLYHSSEVRVRTPLSLKSGSEGKRWVVLSPAERSLYAGPAVDKEIMPETIGGTWTPSIPSGSKPDVDVVMHFHGGAYVIGDGRDHDAGFAAKTLLKHGKFTHVFAPQYRLASNKGGRFPAPLQDAITCYSYLISGLKIPASRITFSGDSAGANLALALLRYIAEYGKEANLPWPAAVLLWSPWVNLAAAVDPKAIERTPNYRTDYLCGSFGSWGAQEFTTHHDPRDPYISPLGHPFKSESLIWVQTGDAEVIHGDDVQLAKELEGVQGNKVQLVVSESCPHDIILIGHLLGFAKKAGDEAKRAGEWVRANRKA